MSGIHGNVEAGLTVAFIGFVVVLAAMFYMTKKERMEDRRVTGTTGSNGKNGKEEGEKGGGWWRRKKPRKPEMEMNGAQV